MSKIPLDFRKEIDEIIEEKIEKRSLSLKAERTPYYMGKPSSADFLGVSVDELEQMAAKGMIDRHYIRGSVRYKHKDLMSLFQELYSPEIIHNEKHKKPKHAPVPKMTDRQGESLFKKADRLAALSDMPHDASLYARVSGFTDCQLKALADLGKINMYLLKDEAIYSMPDCIRLREALDNNR